MLTKSLSIAALCLAVIPLDALAERGGNGYGNRDQAHANRDARAAARDERRNGGSELNRANGNSANARANPSQGFCPPGLRKQEQGCVPAGQAAQGVTAAEWAEQQGYRYVAGAQLEDDDYTLLPNYADYGLPDLPEGETYAVINRTAVVIDETTATLLRVATR